MSKEKTKIEPRVAPEVARAEFDRWADEWAIDTETDAMTEDDRRGFEALRRRVCVAIQRGDLVVTEGADLEYTFRWTKLESLASVTLTPPTGKAIVGFDKYKESQGIHRLNEFMASLCGENPVIFSRMDLRDTKTLQAVAQLFLAS